MCSILKKWENIFLGILWVVYGGGIIAHLHEGLYEFTKLITDELLFVTNVLVLFFVYKKQDQKKLLWWCLGAFLLTFGLEVLGVSTGKVFGVYEYGATLKWQLWGIPLVIGMNWVMLTLAGLDIGQRFLPKKIKKTTPVFAAFLVVFFDWWMEPIAIHLDYWHWFGAAVPLQNYLAWFVIALLAGLVYKKMNIATDSYLLRTYFLIQALFFVVLNLFLL